MSKRTGLDTRTYERFAGERPADYERSEFERSLLASAGADGPTPAESERAWLAFEGDAGALAALATPRLAPSAWKTWSAAPRAQALQWLCIGALCIGALGGGSLVALWRPLEPSAVPPPPLPKPVHATAALELAPLELAPLDLAPLDLAPLDLAPLEPGQEPAPALAARSGAPPRSRAAGAPPRSPSPRPAQGVAPESQLAREVAALDAARAALAIGANARVLQQIERYHREFPGGALAADADVVAIEALAAEGDRAALARAVQRFLRIHPRDPHAARIRELERAGVRKSGL